MIPIAGAPLPSSRTKLTVPFISGPPSIGLPSKVTVPLTWAKPLPHPRRPNELSNTRSARIRPPTIALQFTWHCLAAVARATRAIQDIVDAFRNKPHGAIGKAKMYAAWMLAAEPLGIPPSASDGLWILSDSVVQRRVAAAPASICVERRRMIIILWYILADHQRLAG